MKNIHILPTNKPSRLYEFGGQFILTHELTDAFRNYNIYITNDEPIKEGDWVIQVNFEKTNIQLVQCVTEFQTKMANDKNGSFTKNKIILTTDKNLDGIQSIDDEFLEWFVKNPSCEEVEVESFCKHGDSCPSKGAYDKQYLCDVGYKIIIPQEKP